MFRAPTDDRLVGGSGLSGLLVLDRQRSLQERVDHQLDFARADDQFQSLLVSQASGLERLQERVDLVEGELQKACHDDVPIFYRYICLRTIRIQLF